MLCGVTSDIDADWRPAHGSMRHEFTFDPLHYGAGGRKQQVFKQRVGEELRQYGFLFTGEVRLTWHLFLDEQDRWESDTGADVDNFAKLLNDAVKGPDGLLFDDCQVQRLEVAWLAADAGQYFELTVHSLPDEFVTRPVSLYELGDGLWYPISDLAAANRPGMAILLPQLDYQARRTKRVRHHLRGGGLSRRDAFSTARAVQPLTRGFHHSRVVGGGFPLIGCRQWLAELGTDDAATPDPEQEAVQLAAALLTTRSRPR
jgi:Holliday junction resolvase RusA-like endonuclease